MSGTSASLDVPTGTGSGAALEDGRVVSIAELKRQRANVTERQLQIKAQLAEMRRLWVCEQIHGDMRLKAALEAELAQLDLQRFQVMREIKLRGGAA